MTGEGGDYPRREPLTDLDPALVAAKKAQEAMAAWFAIPVTTVADEDAPKYRAAQERFEKADMAFADAPVLSPAGAHAKLRALEEVLGGKFDDGDFPTLSWHGRIFKTVLTYINRLDAERSGGAL